MTQRRPTIFVTRTGRQVPEADTDHAGSEMLVRTVSRNADGTPRDRPTVCIAPEATGGKVDRAQAEADELDRRGYLPPAIPMTRAEHARIVAEHRLSDFTARVIWDVCGRGLTISLACHWAAGTLGARYKNVRRAIQRTLKKIGWSESESDR